MKRERKRSGNGSWGCKRVVYTDIHEIHGKPLLKGCRLGFRLAYKGVTYYPCFRGFDRDNYYTENKDNNFKRKLSFI